MVEDFLPVIEEDCGLREVVVTIGLDTRTVLLEADGGVLTNI